MAINELIARGVAPIGRDLPDVQNILAQRQEAQQRNALLASQQRMQQDRISLDQQQFRAQQLSAEQQMKIRQKYSEVAGLLNAPTEAKAAYIAQQMQTEPEFARTPFAQMTPDQAIPAMFDGLSAALGQKVEQRQAPVPVPFEQSDTAKEIEARSRAALRLEQQRAANDAALERLRQSGALATAGARTGAQVDQKRAAQQQTFALYESARDGLLSALSGTPTGPVAGRIPAVTTGQQVAEGGVAAMAPVLKQIFRVAGEGTFTDKDQELLLQMVPTRRDTPEAAKAKIANIDNIVRAKLGVAPAENGGPKPGAIEDGYRFKGGNPADPNSWEPVR